MQQRHHTLPRQTPAAHNEMYNPNQDEPITSGHPSLRRCPQAKLLLAPGLLQSGTGLYLRLSYLSHTETALWKSVMLDSSKRDALYHLATILQGSSNAKDLHEAQACKFNKLNISSCTDFIQDTYLKLSMDYIYTKISPHMHISNNNIMHIASCRLQHNLSSHICRC